MKKYIGIMSGTSLDGIDCVIASFIDKTIKIHATQHTKFKPNTRAMLKELQTNPSIKLADFCRLDNQLAQEYSIAVQSLLATNNTQAKDISAIGCHGQTIYHLPNDKNPSSLQLGDPHVIATTTNITTITDFRRNDLAHGGQGAPLTPAFHAEFFNSNNSNRTILNIGGIANLTILHNDKPIIGFDTGPGNTLLDAWCEKHTGQKFDLDGNFAKSGAVDKQLLSKMLQEPYFAKPTPKSTGQDLFNLNWLQQFIQKQQPADIQATLTELTARTIAKAISKDNQEVIICGGGAHNKHLINRAKTLLPKQSVYSTASLGIEPDWVEATAFAWLAKQRINNLAANLPSVTGAKQKCLLGNITNNSITI